MKKTKNEKSAKSAIAQTKTAYANIDAYKAKADIFAKFGASPEKTDAFVEKLLFRHVEVKPADSEAKENNVLSESLSFANLDKNRNLVFDDEENSLALKSLQSGQVDFHDKRVNIQAASLDQSQATNGHQLLEVELGDLKSLSHDEVTVKQMKKQGLKSGQNVIDDEQGSEYKLVMVGRKVSQGEYEQN